MVRTAVSVPGEAAVVKLPPELRASGVGVVRAGRPLADRVVAAFSVVIVDVLWVE
jgi:hypothetical protein